jgi:hypothetical protein
MTDGDRSHDEAELRLAKDPRSLGDTEPPVEHHAPVRSPAIAPETASQPRIVGEDGPTAHDHRVVLLSQKESEPPRRRSGDPAAFPSRCRDPTVEARSPLGKHEWPPLGDPDSKLLILFLCPAPTFPVGPEDFHACAREACATPAANERVGIARPDDHARNARGEDRVGAGRRSPEVAARLKCYVEIRSPRSTSRLREGHDLRVSPAGAPVEGLADHRGPPHDDGAHHWVGGNGVPAALRQLEGAIHPLQVDGSQSLRFQV